MSRNLLVWVVLVGSCGTPAAGSITTTWTAGAPARSAGCAVQVAVATPAELALGGVYGGGDRFKHIGRVTVRAASGVGYTLDGWRDVIHERVCELGAEVAVVPIGEGQGKGFAKIGDRVQALRDTAIPFDLFRAADAKTAESAIR